MEKVNIHEKLALFGDYWNPRIVGELNDSYIKLTKLKGDFVWHQHAEEDEMFLVIAGTLVIEVRDQASVTLTEGEFVIVPKGVEHRPVAAEEVHVMLIESKSTVNTGDVTSDRTREQLEFI